MNQILITGGLGFIGYNLAIKLLSLGYNVVVVDAKKQPALPNLSNENLVQYKMNKLSELGAKIIIANCNDKPTIEGVLSRYKPEYIFHLASLSIAGVANYNPDLAKEDIFDATFSLLKVLKNRELQPKKLIYMSSSMVYGHFLKDVNGSIIPAEEEQICNPICIYGSLKLACEKLLYAWHNLSGLEYNIVRATAVYGPFDNNKRVVETFLKNAMVKKPLLIENQGKHQLDFTYINDLINGLILLMKTSVPNGEIYNISFGKGYQIAELADQIKTHIQHVEIEHSNNKPFRPNRGALNINKAKKDLSYIPEYSLDKGIMEYYSLLNNEPNENSIL